MILKLDRGRAGQRFCGNAVAPLEPPSRLDQLAVVLLGDIEHQIRMREHHGTPPSNQVVIPDSTNGGGPTSSARAYLDRAPHT
jgi:hypothetical protein